MIIPARLYHVGITLLTSGLVAQRLGAQSPSTQAVDVGIASYSGVGAGVSGPLLLLAPSVGVEREWWTALLRTEAEFGEHTARLSSVDASASLVVARVGALRAEVSGAARHDGTREGVPTDLVGAQARIHAPYRAGGVWAGAGAQRVWASGVGRVTPIATAGASLRHRGITLTGSLTFSRLPELRLLGPFDTLDVTARRSQSGMDSLPPEAPPGVPPDTGSGAPPPSPPPPNPGRRIQWGGQTVSASEAQIGMQWSVGRIDLRGTAGGWLGGTTGRRSWASVHATFWLTPRFALVAGGGRRTLGPATGGVSRPFATVAIRLARSPRPDRTAPGAARPAAPSMRVTRTAAGQATIEVIVPAAARVELRGDITQWNAVDLTRAGTDRWIVRLPVSPGIHHVTLRIDGGAWMSPPGLPTMTDGYGGLVGILLVE